MEIPGLGSVTQERRWWYSNPIAIPMFGGKQARIGVKNYDTDAHKEEFHAAIANFLSATPDILRTAEGDLFRYYQDCQDAWVRRGNRPIQSPEELWQHIRFVGEADIQRRRRGDQAIYISVECGCDWEPEHGLGIVLKNGLTVSRIGPYDGHLTNSDASADPSLENLIYRPRR